MKKVGIIFLILGMLSCAEKKSAENKESKQESSEKGKFPLVKFEDETHDFGQVKSGEILTYSFVFINQGNTDLVISNAEVDCGCIEVNLPTESVKPGEKGIVEVEFNSAGLIGKQLKTIEIQSNSKEPKHLIIFAEVENEQIEFKY